MALGIRLKKSGDVGNIPIPGKIYTFKNIRFMLHSISNRIALFLACDSFGSVTYKDYYKNPYVNSDANAKYSSVCHVEPFKYNHEGLVIPYSRANTLDTSSSYYSPIYRAAATAVANQGTNAHTWTNSDAKTFYNDGKWVVRYDGQGAQVSAEENAAFGVRLYMHLDKITFNGNIIEESFNSDVNKFTIGQTYTFGNNGSTDILWFCAEKFSDFVVLISTGGGSNWTDVVTTGAWPGYKMAGPSDGSESWGGANTYYNGEISYKDIHTYDTKMSTLYDSIKNAEKITTVNHDSKGLFLLSHNDLEDSDSYYSYSKKPDKQIAKVYQHAMIVPESHRAWTGTGTTSGGQAYYMYYDSPYVSYDYTGQGVSYDIHPAFNLDPSKVDIDSNNRISIKGSGQTIDDFTLGETYTLGNNGTQDIQWVCAEKGADYIVMQSTGITAGAWPGYKMTGPSDGSESWGNANTNYTNDIDGKDIHTYDTKISTLYDSIENAEKTDTSYGNGLFLVSNSKAGATTSGSQGSGNYWSALKTAATIRTTFGASGDSAWLGTVNGANGNWYIYKSGAIYNNIQNQAMSYVIAPAFNLDPSKVQLDTSTNTITIL